MEHRQRRPALDGVRGLAVLAVLGFHLEVGGGGHAAVTVFFVLSGYLITAGLLAEHRQRGRIDLRGFYARRVRRLAPAALLVTALTLAGAALGVGRAGDPALVVRSVVAAWTQTADLMLAAGGAMAYELVPTWSLNVEEQFYVLWSLAAVLLLPRLRRRVLLLLTAATAATALAWTAWLSASGAGVDRVTYAPDTQLAGPVAGCALALALADRRVAAASSRWRPVLLTLGGATLVVALVDPPLGVPLYSWGGPVVVVGTAALLAGIVAAGRPEPVTAVLALPPLTWLGVRSYAVYLVHVPVLQWFGGPGGAGRSAGVVAVTLALAAASWRWIESPVLRGGLRRGRRGAGVGPAATAPAAVDLRPVPSAPGAGSRVSEGASGLG